MSRLARRLNSLSDATRRQLWPLRRRSGSRWPSWPGGLPRLDARVDASLSGQVDAYLFGGGADAARTVMGATASSLITVTSLTFSLTVVTLLLASSQLSPRLLRTFTRDRFVQGTLALFLGTFIRYLRPSLAWRQRGVGRVTRAPRAAANQPVYMGIAASAGGAEPAPALRLLRRNRSAKNGT